MTTDPLDNPADSPNPPDAADLLFSPLADRPETPNIDLEFVTDPAGTTGINPVARDPDQRATEFTPVVSVEPQSLPFAEPIEEPPPLPRALPAPEPGPRVRVIATRSAEGDEPFAEEETPRVRVIRSTGPKIRVVEPNTPED